MWGEGPSRIAHAANLLVTVAACAADPTGLAVTGAAATGVLSLKDIFKASTPEAKALIKSLTAELESSLDNPSFHMPAHGPALLPQMVEAALPTPAQVIGCNLDADALLGLMLDRLTDPEHRVPEMAEAFCNWVRPSLTRLLADQTFTQTLAPLIARETLSRLTDLADGLVSLSTKFGTLADALKHLQSLRQKELEALVFRFGLTPPSGAAPEALIALLEQYAVNIVNDQARMGALLDRVVSVANLKGAAQDAAARLDFDEVESLLSRVSEVELDIAAATTEARAENALMYGNAEKAFTLFSAAADSFTAFGPVQVAQRRRAYAERLQEHGLRFGGRGNPLSISLLERLLADLPSKDEPMLWAWAQNTLLNSYQQEAARKDGKERLPVLEKAVSTAQKALKVFTKVEHPLWWAAVQLNLGGILFRRGEISANDPRSVDLHAAIAACDAALEVFSEQVDPLSRLRTLNCKSVALRTLGERQEGKEGVDTLCRSIEVCNQALDLSDRVDDRPLYLATLKNAGDSLQKAGQRLIDSNGGPMLFKAVRLHQEVCSELDPDKEPMDWAFAKQSLGVSLCWAGAGLAGEAGERLSLGAIAVTQEAQTVLSRAAYPYLWARTEENIAFFLGMHSSRRDCTTSVDDLRRALTHVDNALSVYDQDTLPSDYESATQIRERILTDLASKS